MKLYWHRQGLSDKSKHPYQGCWPHGRGWLYIGEAGYDTTKTIGIEWHFGSKRCALTLDLNYRGDNAVMVCIAIPWIVALYVTFENVVPQKWLPGHWEPGWDGRGTYWWPEQRVIGVRVHDQIIWFSLWELDEWWSSDDPWWWQFSIHPLDILLGDQKHTRRELHKGDMLVWMPEGPYPAQYTVFESTWKRPRWPWAKRMTQTDVEMGQPIPFSGKGENSYDLDEDGLESITVAADSWHEVQCLVRESVLRTRKKRGDPEFWPIAPGSAKKDTRRP